MRVISLQTLLNVEIHAHEWEISQSQISLFLENECSEIRPHSVIDIRSQDPLFLPVILGSPKMPFLQLPYQLLPGLGPQGPIAPLYHYGSMLYQNGTCPPPISVSSWRPEAMPSCSSHSQHVPEKHTTCIWVEESVTDQGLHSLLTGCLLWACVLTSTMTVGVEIDSLSGSF